MTDTQTQQPNPVSLGQSTFTALATVGVELPPAGKEIIEQALIQAHQASAIETRQECDLLHDAMETQAERRFDHAIRCAIAATLLSLNVKSVGITPETMQNLWVGNRVTSELLEDGTLVYTVSAPEEDAA